MAKKSGFSIKITGFDEIEKKLNKMPKEIGLALKEAVNKGATVFQKEVQVTAPSITNNLVKSVMVEISNEGLTAKIGPDFKQAPYAYYVEHGTTYGAKKDPPYDFAGRHYMEKSFYKKRKEVRNLFAHAVRQLLK
jgi:HK97 gp10 family phage protein